VRHAHHFSKDIPVSYSHSSLKEFANSVLRGFGCDEAEAEIVASNLIDGNLAGHDSHGIGMLPMYGAQVKDGNLIPNQQPDLQEANGAISVVDARRGFGHHMALLALDHAMKTIPEHKVALLGLRNAGHVSRIGTYSEYCAAKGYASIHMANVVGQRPIVAPFGAREGGFSTNPVSMAMPDNGVAKPMLDMATSTIAYGKVRVANNKGESVPSGCLIDAEGVETTNPGLMADQRIGALSAFGAHKGSGLGIFAEIFAGALVGTDTVATAERFPNGVLNNMFSVIIDPSGFDDPENIANRAGAFYDFIKNKRSAKGSSAVLMPGDPENICRKERLKNGILVDDETIRQIISTAIGFEQDGDDLGKILKIVKV
jgi:uncharacterized oxidoreductase